MFPKIGNFSNSAYYSKPSSQIFSTEKNIYPHYGKIYTLPRPYYSQYPNPNSNERSFYIEKTKQIREKFLQKSLLSAKNRQINIEKERILSSNLSRSVSFNFFFSLSHFILL